MDSVHFKDLPQRNSTYIPEIIPEIYTKEDRRLMRQLLERRLVEKEQDMVVVRHRLSVPMTSKASSIFSTDRKTVSESHHGSTFGAEIKLIPHETLHSGNEDYKDYLDKLMKSKRIDDRIIDKTASADAFFRKVRSTHTDFVVWRVEDFALTSVPKEQLGTFYSLDTYLIYAVSQVGQFVAQQTINKEIKGKPEFHVHFWLGAKSEATKLAAAAYKAVELDIFLGGTSTEHREFQGYESPRFKSYFPQGITVLSGSSKSFTNLSIYDPCLYKIKGTKAPCITQMSEVSWKYLNSKDVFVLHTKNIIFIWIGRSSKAIEKLHATKAATRLGNEFEINNIVFVDDGYEKTLYDEDKHEFDKFLPLKQRSIKLLDEDIDVHKRNTSYVKLYYCFDILEKYRVTEMKNGPLNYEDLLEHNVYIIDHAISGVWIWVKKAASQKDKVEAIRNARGFVKKKKYPSSTKVTRVVEGYEPLEFRFLFKSWPQDYRNTGSKIAVVKVTRFDAITMEERPALAAKSQLLDDGTGLLKIFRIKRFNSVELPKDRHGIFFTGDCYVILYRYKTTDVKWIIYYWMGMSSIPDEQEYAALKALEFDLTITEGNAVFVRVIQGREPVHLLQLFKGRLMIFNGKGTDCDVSGKNTKSPYMYLLQVEGSATYDTKAVQVPFKASSLNSNFCFVLKKNDTTYIWCGTHSTGDNREMAKLFVGVNDFHLLLEGNESNDFWNALGGKQSYSHRQNPDDMFIYKHPPRLFLCDYYNGEMIVEELFNFSQKDLSPELILVLDAGHALYEWIGNNACKEDQKSSLQLVKDFLKMEPSDRDPKMSVIQVKQGHEPPTFTGFFETWDNKLWTNYKSYECLRTEIESDGSRFINKLTNSQNNIFDNFNKYPVSVLKESVDALPSAVNPLNKELHLTYDDFMTLFEMDYQEFEKLPMWKRQEMKKNVGLF